MIIIQIHKLHFTNKLMSNLQKAVVFTLTFSVYVGLHGLRQGWSYSKKQIGDEFGITTPQFGLIDTLYLFSYSLGMGILGNFSSKTGLKYFILIGMVLATLFYMMSSFIYFISKSFNYPLTVVWMCLNGFFQSTAWPGMMGIFGNWFGKGKRGLLMGLWSMNANAGNIIALLMCNVIDQQLNGNWSTNFVATGGLSLAIAVVCLFFLKQEPEKSKLMPLVEEQQEMQNDKKKVNDLQQKSVITSNENESIRSQPPEQQRQINVFTALFLPRVPFYVIGYACTKGCIIGLLFWLPTYLDNQGLREQKGYISSMVDLGSFIGGMTVGYLGDKYSHRALFLSPLFIIAGVVMFIVSYALTNVAWTYYLALFLIGLMLGGPYNIIGTAIAIDIGEQAGKDSITKVSALIEGSAAVFAAVSQIVISVMPFQYIFYLFCGECIIAAVVLLPLFIRDFKSIRKN